MKTLLNNFRRHDLNDGHVLWIGRLSDELLPDEGIFEALWQEHPNEFHEIKMYGRLIPTPRWQQAYGQDYRYTGRVNEALPIPPVLESFLNWSRDNIDLNLNGLLLNWYDGRLGHYIGRHHDSTVDLVPGSPIVTISLGEERTFRLRRTPAGPGTRPIDIPAANGAVFLMPWETNLAFTHEVPHFSRYSGRRISITIRSFVEASQLAAR